MLGNKGISSYALEEKMTDIAALYAKLAGLYKKLNAFCVEEYVNPAVLTCYLQYDRLREQLISQLPELYSDLSSINLPDSEKGSFIERFRIEPLRHELEYIFEVHANSKIVQVIDMSSQEADARSRRVFISHGRCHDWLKVQVYIIKDVGIDTLELAQEANRGRTVLQKLYEEADKCSFAVVVMTGEDELENDEHPHARENVMHEIGFFQGKYGLENVCLLYEEGTNIPSNIHGLVYIPYPKGLVEATFGALRRELEAAFTE